MKIVFIWILIILISFLILSSCVLFQKYPRLSITILNISYDKVELQWQYDDNLERLTQIQLRSFKEVLYTFEATNNIIIQNLNPNTTYLIYFIPDDYEVPMKSKTITTLYKNDNQLPKIENIEISTNSATVIAYDIPTGIKEVRFSIQSNENIPTRFDYIMQYKYPNTWTINYELPYKSKWIWQVNVIDNSLNTKIATGTISN